MSRRRRGLFGRIFETTKHFGNEARSWLLWPFFVVRDGIGSLFGGGRSSLRHRPFGQTLLDYVLLIPRWIGLSLSWLYQSLLLWPRIMRLRDLASGLPALLATVAAITILFFLGKEETELIQAYESGSNRSYVAARQETDDVERREALKLAQFYSRALVKLKDDDLTYRFNVGYIYQEMGEYARAQAIMDSLAPRYKQGFAKAHLWQADQLLSPDRPLNPDTLDAAEAHLLRALATYPDPEEIHRRLGELYYFRYVRYNPRTIDPRIPSKEIYLTRADEHLSQVKSLDPKLALTRAEIRGLQNRTQQAELDVRRVITDLTARIKNVPDDMETRIRLAQAYRMVSEFDGAAEVLQAGMRLRPNIRYDQELSGVHYFKSLHLRKNVPNSLQQQFAALRKSYLAYSTNNYLAYRLVQALASESEEEARMARGMLQSLVEQKTSGQMAVFLLGFDSRRRTLPTKAEEYFRMLRSTSPDATPEVIAGLATAVLNGQVKTISGNVAHQLFETSLQVWPNHPDLLMFRAQQNLMLKDFGRALGDLNKALEQRPKDARLHEMLAVTYQQLGLADQAQKHRELAEAVRPNATPPKLN